MVYLLFVFMQFYYKAILLIYSPPGSPILYFLSSVKSLIYIKLAE